MSHFLPCTSDRRWSATPVRRTRDALAWPRPRHLLPMADERTQPAFCERYATVGNRRDDRGGVSVRWSKLRCARWSRWRGVPSRRLSGDGVHQQDLVGAELSGPGSPCANRDHFHDIVDGAVLDTEGDVAPRGDGADAHWHGERFVERQGHSVRIAIPDVDRNQAVGERGRDFQHRSDDLGPGLTPERGQEKAAGGRGVG